jgi:hypothetical protein
MDCTLDLVSNPDWWAPPYTQEQIETACDKNRSGCGKYRHCEGCHARFAAASAPGAES